MCVYVWHVVFDVYRMGSGYMPAFRERSTPAVAGAAVQVAVLRRQPLERSMANKVVYNKEEAEEIAASHLTRKKREREL